MAISIHDYIKTELIKKRGFTNAQLARELGIKEPSIGRYLTGKQEPSEETCEKLARLVAGNNYKGELEKILILRQMSKADESIKLVWNDMLKRLAKTGTFTIGVAMFILISILHTTPASASNSREGVLPLFDNNIHYATLRRWFKRWFGLTPRSTSTLQLA